MPSGAGVFAAQPRIKFVRGMQTCRVITHLRASCLPVSFLKSKQEEAKRPGLSGVFGGEAAFVPLRGPPTRDSGDRKL